MKTDINKALVIAALRRRHSPPGWVFATEIQTTTGFGDGYNYEGPGGVRRIDAFAMAVWPSRGYERIAYEIKLTRDDWLRELREPAKRAQAFLLSDKFYFVLAPGIFEQGDGLKARNCGVIEISEKGQLRTIRRPPRRRVAWPMPIGFVASFMRRVRDCAGGSELTSEAET